jgi:methionyl-tRNA formyltransferase
MDAGLDTGPVVSRHVVAIGAEDNAGSLHDKLAAVGAAAIVETLAVLARDGKLKAAPQESAGITCAPKFDRDEARIVWTRSASEIARQVRAFNPVPGAFTSIDGGVLKVWRAKEAGSASAAAEPGQIAVRKGLLVAACGKGEWVALEEVQPAGGRRMPGMVYVVGRPEIARHRLGT